MDDNHLKQFQKWLKHYRHENENNEHRDKFMDEYFF